MEKSKNSKLFSHKVTIVSFIMAILVIYAHANSLRYYGLEGNTKTVEYVVIESISGVIATITITFFLIMSGYWFFHFDISSESAMDRVKDKLKKRGKTVVIPYLLWNTFGMVFYMLITHVPSLAQQMNNGEVIAVNAQNILSGVLLHKYYFTFWYMQDLIVMSLFTPLFLLILKNRVLSLCTLAVTIAIAYFHIDLHILYSCNSPMFFFLGGFLSVYYSEWFEKRTQHGYIWLAVFLVLCVIRFFKVPYITDPAYFISPVVLWKVFDLFLSDTVLEKEPTWFMKQNFYIYATHVIPITILGHVFAKIGSGTAWIIVSYLAAPCIVLALIYVSGRLLSRFTPKFYHVINGSRG